MSPLPEPPTDPVEIEKVESSLELPRFTADDAYTLGTSIRAQLRKDFPNRPAVVNITLTNSSQLLFHATSLPGTLPDNDSWVARKRKTVLRWGKSSWYMGRKFAGDEAKFSQVYQLGDSVGEYAIHGGAVPIRVKGVEGAVAICIVSGLKQEMDHQIVVEGLKVLKESMKSKASTKRKTPLKLKAAEKAAEKGTDKVAENEAEQ